MKFKKYNVCVIDDEPEIRKILIKTLDESLDFKVIGEAEDVESGVELILNKQPDAVFLDIKLRGGDAFQLLSFIKRRMDLVPAIILNTGYSDFDYAQKAINDFRNEVVMILQKPFWEDWEKKEIEIIKRINDYYPEDQININMTRLSIRSDHTTWLIHLSDLIFIEVPIEFKGRGKLNLVTTYKSFVINNSLQKIEEELPAYFIRINRYTIVNKQYLSHFDHSEQLLFLRGMLERNFSVGDTYKKEVLKEMEIGL
jgi:DNA-binding LytR/AlgR family response regulator